MRQVSEPTSIGIERISYQMFGYGYQKFGYGYQVRVRVSDQIPPDTRTSDTRTSDTRTRTSDTRFTWSLSLVRQVSEPTSIGIERISFSERFRSSIPCRHHFSALYQIDDVLSGRGECASARREMAHIPGLIWCNSAEQIRSESGACAFRSPKGSVPASPAGPTQSRKSPGLL